MDQQRLQAMQALMHRMGMAGDGAQFAFGGMGGMGGGGAGGGSQTQQILAKIKSHSEAEQLDGLNDFVHMLNMATEQVIMSINPANFVSPIMACFQKHHNPELMLVAARSLTYLVDANTHTVRVLQRDDHLNVLLDSLRSIMDVEFAEQVLTCVDKIATDDPAMVLQKDGVSAIMGFMDFFSITTQRLIMHTVARIADSFRPMYYGMIESSLPTIRASLRNDDNRMREEALTALTRFIKRASVDPSCVKKIYGDSGPAVMDILEKRPTNAMFGTAIQLISTATNASAAVCETMIEIGAVSFLAGLLESNNQSLLGNTSSAVNNSSSMVGTGEANSPIRIGSLDDSTAAGAPSSPMSAANSSQMLNTSSGGGAAAAGGVAAQRIPHERVIDICNCLVSFAPDIVDKRHYINYIEGADRVEAMGATSTAAATGKRKSSAARHESEARAFLKALARGVGGGVGGGSDEDDDNADEEDDMFGDDDDNHMHDDEDADMDGDDEDYEDFDPHSLPPLEQRQHLETLIADGGINIDNKIERNSKCSNGRHTCDVCSDRITDPALWLRCNARDDYDICAACILELDGDDEHTYTLMSAVFPPAAAAAAAAAATTTASASAAATAGGVARPTATTTTAATGEEDQRALRVAMIQKAPYLVNRLAEALPVMCRLHLNSDDTMIRGKCLAFICRVVHHATAECLRQALLDCPMCELVTYLLTSPKLSVLGRCIHICEELMRKLPDIYTDLFIREGVTNGLAVVKSGVSVDKRSDAAERPIESVVATAEGWRAILAYEANEILNKFADSVDSGRIATMESLCKRLRTEADPTEAISQAAEVLSDLSTFELMNSDVVGSILARFTSSDMPEELVARFVSQLASQTDAANNGSSGSEQSATLLGRFVHQLQSAASQIEKFTPPIDGTENAKDPIRLTLKPHDPAAEQAAAVAAAAKDGKKKGKKAAAGGRRGSTASSVNNDNANDNETSGKKKKKASKKGKKGAVEEEVADAPSANANDDDNADVAGGSATPAVPTMNRTEGKSATVSIDPLASVLGIVDFIRNNLLPNSVKNATAASPAAAAKKSAASPATSGTGATEDEDAVEDIDPSLASPLASNPPSFAATAAAAAAASSSNNDNDDTANTAASASSPTTASAEEAATKRSRKETAAAAASAAGPSAADTPIYLRYRTHALPNNWTMLQVMQDIVKKDKAPADKKKGAGGLMGNADVPWQLRQLLALDPTQIVEIYYSTEPYTTPTVTQPIAAMNAQANAESQRPVRFNPNLLLTSGAIAVRNALNKPYVGSEKFVAPVLADLLKLLAVLFAACSEWSSLMTWLAMKSGSYALPKSMAEPRVAYAEFVNPKVNSKAMQHSANIAMAGRHDQAWYVRILHDYPFLFTPATRKFLFEVTYFGVSRSLVRLQELAAENGTLVDHDQRSLAGRKQNRIVRRKCRVVREKPLECAMQVLSSSKATLGSVFEFEFKGEPGSGLGPTMEFYSLVGTALSGKNLGLWRRSEDDTETHFAPMLGLYPAPFMPSASASAGSSSSPTSAGPSAPLAVRSTTEANIIKYNTFLGRFLARVLLDRRIPNLRLSRPLLKMLRGDELAFDDIYSINPKVYEVLLAMVISDHSGADKGTLNTLAKPCSVEDLCLNFTLPGMEEIPLVPNGADMDVTAANMGSYAQELATALLCNSVKVAVKALREGFSSVINLQALRALTLDELSGTLKGHEERISLAELEANVACDHGYSASSPTIRIFLNILAEMTQQEQQKFFQFLTGSPMLPVGGLAALKPKFTIVRKTSSDPKVPEQSQLPSAMTCQNFLKLPAYDTKELMAKKLKLAVDEGANAFLFT